MGSELSQVGDDCSRQSLRMLYQSSVAAAYTLPQQGFSPSVTVGPRSRGQAEAACSHLPTLSSPVLLVDRHTAEDAAPQSPLANSTQRYLIFQEVQSAK